MKEEIRKLVLDKRDRLSKTQVSAASLVISKNLKKLGSFKDAKTIMFYVSFGNEVYTHDLIKEYLSVKSAAVPKIVEHEIEPSLVIDFDSLAPSGKFGIPEPMELMKVSYKGIGAVLVPGVAFDKNGHRIGFGFGHYDKFLKKVPHAVKIGLAFDFQVVDLIPKEEHDVAMDFIVTEKRVVDCNKHN
ncbi:MAG TPA: 5-formyltetrahydrofolate cyclo-ligase [Candidatus Nanoarchaeia archaeon]|nr:5-formyltetrahydrofolate cyclo-ligase [Candidatus Nanoarchaeia archaeon]